MNELQEDKIRDVLEQLAERNIHSWSALERIKEILEPPVDKSEEIKDFDHF